MFNRIFRSAKKLSHILHVTDNEGTEFFFKAIKNSRIVSCDGSRLQFKKVDGIPYFIFGGDATDRGHYDLVTTKLLVDFKKRYPENVILLAGNREIKQNRFKIELAEPLIRERLFNTMPPRWLSSKFNSTPLDYVKKEMVDKQLNANSDRAIARYINSLSISQCQLIYLHWMLEKNMGSPNTFRYRREELQAQRPEVIISDEDVLQSFLKEIKPEGLIGQYLQLAQIGVIIPNTRVMAVHGGFTADNIGRIPGMLTHEKPIQDIRLWLSQFNSWYKEQIQKWIMYQPVEMTQPGFTALDESVLPIPGTIKYVITADMLGKSREFIEVPDIVSNYLHDNGISLLLTGHQPCGDHPVIRRNQANNLLLIDGDTGYAKSGSTNPDDTRGSACHTLEISANAEQASVHIQATLSNDVKVVTTLVINREQITGDDYTGRLLSGNRLVQCRLDEDHYRLITQKEFLSTYSVVTPQDIENTKTSTTQKSF